jgi:hypothetical protein
MASNGCLSTQQLPIPSAVIFPRYDAVVQNFPDFSVAAEVVVKQCIARVVVSVMSSTTGEILRLSADALDVREDGSLGGPAVVTVLGQNQAQQCSASISVELVPQVPDAGTHADAATH